MTTLGVWSNFPNRFSPFLQKWTYTRMAIRRRDVCEDDADLDKLCIWKQSLRWWTSKRTCWGWWHEKFWHVPHQHTVFNKWWTKIKGSWHLKGSYSTDTGKSWNFKSQFSGLGSPGIRPKSWKVVKMWIADVTNFLMISEWLLGSGEFWSHLVFSWICEPLPLGNNWIKEKEEVC